MKKNDTVKVFLYWDGYVYLTTYQDKPLGTLTVNDFSINDAEFVKENSIDYLLIRHIVNNEKFMKIKVGDDDVILSTFNRNNDDINYIFSKVRRSKTTYNMNWFPIDNADISTIIPKEVKDSIYMLEKDDDLKNNEVNLPITNPTLKDAIDALSNIYKNDVIHDDITVSLKMYFNMKINITFKDCTGDVMLVKPVFSDYIDYPCIKEYNYNIYYTDKFFKLNDSERRFVLLYELGAIYATTNTKTRMNTPHNFYSRNTCIRNNRDDSFKNMKFTDFYHNGRFDKIDDMYETDLDNDSLFRLCIDIVFIYKITSTLFDFILTDHIYYNEHSHTMIFMVTSNPSYNKYNPTYMEPVYEIDFNNNIDIDITKASNKEVITVFGKLVYSKSITSKLLSDFIDRTRLMIDVGYCNHTNRFVNELFYNLGKQYIEDHFDGQDGKKNVIGYIENFGKDNERNR